MLCLNYFIHSSWQLRHRCPTLGIDPALRLLLAEMGLELDSLAPNYLAPVTFPLCSAPQSRRPRGSHLQRRRMRPGKSARWVRHRTQRFGFLARFICTTCPRGRISHAVAGESDKGGAVGLGRTRVSRLGPHVSQLPRPLGSSLTSDPQFLQRKEPRRPRFGGR